ncbi:MAG TPA: hypothetical protein PK052_07445 [Anaerohalosphaeraceae bacterium]|nr:hypothetical protein [Anaerohalosphaeraceae bacterium]HOM76926.1 hypothetical protein [Anaerohalosphaeraceae bacterium]HPC64992.1 hypothetical protein [Anaerohalosphaeraceae bacterium]HRS72045.1 hypothetical protein [Anaerohalosphaeraceae bacterium]
MNEIEVRNRKAKQAMDELSRAYKTVFSGQAGQRVLADISRFCGADAVSASESQPNALTTFFREGKRSVFLRIIWQLNRKESND